MRAWRNQADARVLEALEEIRAGSIPVARTYRRENYRGRTTAVVGLLAKQDVVGSIPIVRFLMLFA